MTSVSEPLPVLEAGRGSSRRRRLAIGVAMAVAWLATDAGLEMINRATGLVRSVGPASFLIGPLAAVAVGWAAGLRSRRDWLQGVLIVFGGATILFVIVAQLGLGGGAPSRGPDVSTLDFGVGGNGCDLERSARAFSSADSIVAAAEFMPPIATGSTITIRLTRDGTMVADYPVVQVADEPWPCVYGLVESPPIAPGRYRWEIEVSGSPMPPLAGEFTVAGS